MESLKKIVETESRLYTSISKLIHITVQPLLRWAVRGTDLDFIAQSEISEWEYTHDVFQLRAPIAQSYLQMARLIGCREIVNDLYSFPVDEKVSAGFRNKVESLMNKNYRNTL